MTCSKKEDPIDTLLADLETAAEARDVEPFEKRLMPGFSGNEMVSREESLAQLRRYFAAYEVIQIDIGNVERSESGNRVTFHVTFSGKANAAFNLQNLLPSSAAYDFELLLLWENGMMKVKKAFWQETSTL